MAESDPIKIKRTPVKGFTKGEWSHVCDKIMQDGLECKFAKNTYLKEMLLNTKGMKIAEASPNDRYWGIGCNLTSEDLHDEDKWGQNRLGQYLMILRDKLS